MTTKTITPENNDTELLARQGKAIADLFNRKIKDNCVRTSHGPKTFVGLARTVIHVIGGLKAEDTEAKEEMAGKNLVRLLYLRTSKGTGRYNLQGGDKTTLGLIRTARRVIAETK